MDVVYEFRKPVYELKKIINLKGNYLCNGREYIFELYGGRYCDGIEKLMSV